MRMFGVAVLLFAACSSESVAPVNDLVASVTVTPATFRVGDSATVRVVVTNQGDRTRTILVNECLQTFGVTTENGTHVGPGQRLCDASAEAKTLAPGGQLVIEQAWIGDGIRGDVNDPPAMLAPGTYLLRSRVLGNEGDDGPTVTVHLTA